MRFAFTDEQNLIKESADKFVDNDYPFEVRRRLAGSEEGFSRDHWSAFAGLGWLGLGIPEADGGFGGSAVETAILMEAFGRALVVEPYLSTAVLGGTLLELGGSAAQRQALLPALVSGELLLAFAFAERQSRYNLADVAVRAAADGEGYRIDGAKSVVLNAASADKIIVSARTGGGNRERDGISLFIVERDAPGLALRSYATVDGLKASEVTLENVRVGPDALLGEPDGAYPLIEKAIDAGIVAVCAEAVGIMRVLLDTTGEYLKTRRQFGRPLADFQVLQHRMVDMLVAYELSKSMAYMAAAMWDDAEPAELRRRVSAAKVQIGEAGRFIGQSAIQLHGGVGMTDELAVSHYFKRLAMIDVQFGDSDHHLQRFAESI